MDSHIKYTIPPALCLTILAWPLLSRIDLCKIALLVTIAVVSTIPWDSYLIRQGIWTYPSNVIIGPTLFQIPLEEVFFFFIQTYITSLVYLLLSKATFYPAYLVAANTRNTEDGKLSPNPKYTKYRTLRDLGNVILIGLIGWASFAVKEGGHSTYLGLILVWALPFIILLWTLGYQLLIGLPYSNTVFPILIPTFWLWAVDTWALRKGTWSIQTETKLSIYLWHGLEIEEAIFFLLTNTLVVLGLIAFDCSLAVYDAFPNIFPDEPLHFKIGPHAKALLLSATAYDDRRLLGLSEAVARLKRKSRSFFLASGTFEGRLRADLILLYSYCRAVDDLVDEASTPGDAKSSVSNIKDYLNTVFAPSSCSTSPNGDSERVIQRLPKETRTAFFLLPTHNLLKAPLVELLNGMETDLAFSSKGKAWPIKDEESLETYARQVASTVAELCIHLLFVHSGITGSARDTKVIDAGRKMGIALQYINIARDVSVDAENNRVYLPTSWLKDEGMTPEMVIDDPGMKSVERLKRKLLDKAMKMYQEARPAMENLPRSGRAALKVAVESYVEIGRVLQRADYRFSRGRATVPVLRRLFIAWKALSEG